MQRDLPDLTKPASEVAPGLLGATIWHGPIGIRLTEVEAYLGAEDPASHAFRGPTPRARVMFGAPSHMYVYLSYGIHRCVNIVCSPEGTASAVLLRAGQVVSGQRQARQRRGDVPVARLARGPGNLGQALGAELDDSGAPLQITASPSGPGWHLEPPTEPVRACAGPRVGISRNTDAPLRFWIDGDPTVSRLR